MLNYLKITILSVATLAIVAGCANTTAPITGRKQMITVSPAQEVAMGTQYAQQVLSQVRISREPKANALLQEVGGRIASVSGQPNYQWAFYMVDDPNTANAFALPGGKVFVYSGILKYMSSKDELAAVVAHEVGHALARHGAERQSSTQLANLGGAVLGAVMQSSGVSSANANSALQAYGMASKYGVILPYSRTQEYEADRIGLLLAAKAGYNPNAAVTFWQKFIQTNGSARGPEYTSTHPDPYNRINAIKQQIPSVMPYYQQARR